MSEKADFKMKLPPMHSDDQWMSEACIVSGSKEEALTTELAEVRAALAESLLALRARDDFLAIAAHELRTPMNAMSLQIAAIERMAARDGAQRIEAELVRARQMMARYLKRAVVLLDVSRLTSGNFSIYRERVDLATVAQGVVDAFLHEARFHNTEIRLETDPHVVGMWDSQALEQVLSNLISNALKYGRGSPVTLRVRKISEAEAQLEVIDQGPGMSAADQQRLFERFERLIDSARVASGFGLGLWISSRLVGAHGGTIQVTSQPGRGSCFTITLPTSAPYDEQLQQKHDQ